MARKKHGNRLEGLQVKVFNNNVEGALKKFKRIELNVKAGSAVFMINSILYNI